MERGRPIDAIDRTAASRVAVVGRFVRRRLGEGRTLLGEERSLIGETVRIAGVPFEIVGELASKGLGSEGSNEGDQILIPIETASRRLFNVDYLSGMLVQVADRERMAGVQSAARELLRESHRLDKDAADDFEILSSLRAEESRRTQSAFLEGLTKVLTAATLLLGGAGVLVVTYLNVADRTPEVGLRMAIGARRRDIATLFLVEACCLSVLGGLLGLLAGGASIGGLRAITDWPMAVAPGAVATPLIAAVLLGIGFGAGPAVRASRLMPVQALSDA